MKNPKGAWRMCAAASVLLFCVLGMAANAFTVLLPYLTEKCSLTNTQSANLILIRSIFSFLSLFFAGKYYSVLNIRLGAAVAMLLGTCAMVLYGFAAQVLQLYAAAAVMGLSFGLGGMFAASMLVHRWFRIHSSVAVGICAASSGAATIVGAPVLTAIVENFTVSAALFSLAGFLAVCALLFFVMVRNYPPDTVPLQKPPAEKKQRRRGAKSGWMFFAVVLMAMPASTVFNFISMHYTNVGFSAYEVSMLVSVVGTSLMAGKFLFGEAVDHWGARRTNLLFFLLAAAGSGLCCVSGGFVIAFAAMVLYGMGIAYGTVGLSVYAEDLSDPEDFADILRKYQLALQLGCLLTSSVPGILADWTGSYVPSYLISCVLSVLALLIVQRSYRRRKALLRSR